MKKDKLKANLRKHYPKEVREKVVLSIVKGELFIEEAMEKYNVPIRLTVISWLKKYKLKQLNESSSVTKIS